MCRPCRTVDEVLADAAARTREEAGHWLYQGCLDRDGYPMVRCQGKTWYLHRLVWEAIYGPIPPGYDLHHHESCGLRNCWQPDHLQPMPAREHRAMHGFKPRTGQEASSGL